MPPPALSLRPRLSAANLTASPSGTPLPTTPATPHGFRAQINQLLPRHSYFRARVTIHQIDAVPFVSGQFAVRWKFKHVHSPPSTRAGLLGIVKTRSRNGEKRAAREDVGLDATSTSSLGDASVPSVIVSTNSSDSSSSSSTNTTRHPSISSTTTSSTSSYGIPTPGSHEANTSSTTLHIHAPTTRVCASTTATPTPMPLLPSFITSAPTITNTDVMANTPARGHTVYISLKDHSVHWNQTLSTVIRLDVDRDTGYIFPCPFKLVVMHRPSDDDYISSAAENINASMEVHRLGALYLNLSEYVGHGNVERRYLLRESKTNATLKLTINLEFISGQTNYIPPPLPKGEILNGLSGYLESTKSASGTSSARRKSQRPITPTNGLDLYGPYLNQEELELDLFGTRCPHKIPNHNRSKLGLNESYPSSPITGGEDEDDSDIDLLEEFDASYSNATTMETLDVPTPTIGGEPGLHVYTPTRQRSFFDVERLPLAYGTKTTETIIEAIFNPAKTFEERCESPFTIYVPPVRPPQATALKVALTAPGDSLGLITAPIMGLTAEEEGGFTPRLHPSSTTTTTTRPSTARPAIKKKPVPNIESASTYSTETTSTRSSGSGSGGGTMSKSTHSHTSSVDSVGIDARNASGRVKEWWKKTVGGGGSRPGTPGLRE